MTNLLKLLQLADSALPVGALSHSFGLETLIEEGHLVVAGIFGFLTDLLSEGLLLEAVFCRAAHLRAQCGETVEDLNAQLSALKLARESREASLALGRRFSVFIAALEPDLAMCPQSVHFVLAFGYAGGSLCLSVDETVAAFLQQSVATTISVCQRLLRLGQVEAGQINWDVKPLIAQTIAQSSAIAVNDVSSFAHLPELACMRHPLLPTRLFVS